MSRIDPATKNPLCQRCVNKKTSLSADFLCLRVWLVAVLERVFEAFPGFEFWHRNGWDLNFLRWRLRVDAHARSAGFGRKGSESRDVHFASVHEGGRDELDDGLDHFFGLLFGEIVHAFRERENEFRLVHTMDKMKD